MKIRRFYASNIRAALREVTEEFGEDAAILSNKKVEGGVEIIAALDYDADLMREKLAEQERELPQVKVANGSGQSFARQMAGGDFVGQAQTSHAQALSDNSSASIQSNPVPNFGSKPSSGKSQSGKSHLSSVPNTELENSAKNASAEEKVSIAKAAVSQLSGFLANQQQQSAKQNDLSAFSERSQLSSRLRVSAKESFGDDVKRPLAAPAFATEEVEPSVAKTESAPRKNRVEWSLDPSLKAMKEELELMRSMMSEQLRGLAWDRNAERNPLSAMMARRLSKIGLDHHLISGLLPQIKAEQDVECVWQHLLAVLAKSVPVATDNLLEKGGIYAFMGPAGVGKTTTIAKLAARFVIKHGADSVALITTDNYRISAQEQLASIGRLLQLPTVKVSQKQDLDAVISKFHRKKLVLIDTAGISGCDENLAEPLKVLAQSSSVIHRILLMSAASQGKVLQQSLALFENYSPDGIIVTKMDEAACLGELLSVVIHAHIPLLFTTDGQRIPEDIRLAKSHQLVSKAVSLANRYEREVDDWALAQSVDLLHSA
ncbi:flagellar biosynthesis protein FlhF [Aliikangiella maris]|uniref:Flagellar biosynthesis protein FlhF n=2 Tax=Aliikangiella maris TaxID=3162458 RepID=A0ABV2BS49_9GAMM